MKILSLIIWICLFITLCYLVAENIAQNELCEKLKVKDYDSYVNYYNL